MASLFDEIIQKYQAAHRVLSVQFEITHRCVCKCVHCFLHRKPKNELTVDEITELFAQLREEGVFELTLTGGEPFLREDLVDILSAAHKDGFLLSIQTTGILIDKLEANLLKDLGVKNVEMSLHGSTAETHDSVMGYNGAFAHLERAVKRVKEADLPVTLKCVVMQQNHHEVADMARMAKKLGGEFSANAIIFPMESGDLSPQQWMIDEKPDPRFDYKLIEGGMADGEETGNGALLTCRAGSTLCAVTPDGGILPCIIFRREVGSIRSDTFQDIWHEHPDPFLLELRSIKPEDAAECFTCEMRSFCIRCPGVAFMETGDATLPSVSACRVARLLHQRHVAAKAQAGF